MRMQVGRTLGAALAAAALIVVGCASGGDGAASGNGSSQNNDNGSMEAGTRGGRMAAPKLADPVTIEGLEVRVPANWTSETPDGSMRKAQYAIAGSGGEGTAVLYFFGTDQGGSTQDNIDRWIAQFEDPEGGNLKEKAQVGTVSNHGLTSTHVYVEGTMKPAPRMGVAEAHEGWAMLGGVVEGPGGPWFWKATGPEATIAEAKATFEYMLSELRVAG